MTRHDGDPRAGRVVRKVYGTMRVAREIEGRPRLIAYVCECGAEGITFVESTRHCSGCPKCGSGWGGVVPSNPLEHSSYRGMLERCYNRKHIGYPFYGARGVRVCEAWRAHRGFEQFLIDLGRRPGLCYSLDRYPNPSGNYEPGNTRWATHAQQRANHPVGWEAKAAGRRKQTVSTRRAMIAWKTRRTLYWPGQVRAIMGDIEAELVERFGPRRPMDIPRPGEFSVEGFWAGDDAFGDGNFHTDDLGSLGLKLDLRDRFPVKPGWRSLSTKRAA